MRRRFLLAALGALWALAGCGGGADPPAARPESAALKLDIAWPQRSRTVGAPASALSAVVALERGKLDDNAAVTFPAIDRNDAPAAYTQNFVAPTAARIGPNVLTVTFFADKGGTGAVVGVARRTFTLAADGSGAGDIALVGKAQKVTLTGAGSVAVGATAALGFAVEDGKGQAIALSPGSATFAIASGASSLAVSADGVATGLAIGTGSVTATVDGVTSAPLSLSVTAPAGAQAVIAAGQSVPVGETLQLVYSVTDASGNAITVEPGQLSFSVVEGEDILSVTNAGLVTAKKAGTAQVRLRAGDLESAPTPVRVRSLGTVVNIAIAPQQNVLVNGTKPLEFTATDEDGAPLTGATFAVSAGSDVLEIASDGTLRGLAVGVGVVTVTVNGVSQSQSVLVGDLVISESGLKYLDRTAGEGELPQSGQKVTLDYTGTLLDGTKFDSSRDPGRQPFSYTVGANAVIDGFEEGVAGMKPGGRRFLVIPPDLGYGERGQGSIPPNATLIFDIELIKVE